MSESKSECNEEGYSVYEFEEEDSPGSHEYNITIGQDVSAVVVHVEGTNETQVRIGEQEIAGNDESTHTQRSKSSALFLKLDPMHGSSGSADVMVKAYTPKGSRLRITILVLFKKFKKFIGKLSCKNCKKLIRILMSTIFTSIGIPDWLVGAELSAKTKELLEDLYDGIDILLPTAIQEFLKNIDSTFLHRIIGATKKVLAVANYFIEPIDIFYEKICKILGYCKQAEPK